MQFVESIAFDRIYARGLDTYMRLLRLFLSVLITSTLLSHSCYAQEASEPVVTKELKAQKTESEVIPEVLPLTEAETVVPLEEVKPVEVPSPKQPWELPYQLDPLIKIKKIYDFLNDRAKTPTGGEEALEYEFKYYNHGAVTEAQLRNKKGHYYEVNWATDAAVEPLTLRFDYRQKNTRDQVRTIEIPYPKARGSMKGRFSVTGDSYFEDGDVISWRISVVRNGKIVAEKKSFVW